MNFIFTDNVRILCLSCNVKKSENLSYLDKKDRNKRHSSPFIMLSRVSSSWSAYQFHTCLCRPQYIATGYQESVFVG